MNKHLYRIIFNKARGQLMVVGELARSGCKAPVSRPSVISSIQPSVFAGQLKAGALVFMLSMLWHTPLHAQIIADSNAPGYQQPIVTSSAAGVPVVNIQTPSGQGVSRNQYSQFDVNAKGAILNNAHNNVQTQLAGWVQGNPLMAGGSARVILNEVNSSNPSLLNGFVEVAGRRAEVVIANPAGLSCDGCGFINATRSTLTTGTPEFNNGQLSGYRVTGGNIEITGQGLNDRSSDYTDLIARAVKVNAGVWANDLAIQTGTQRVNSRRQTIERLSSIAGKPDYSIDVASLGGMYAGKITLKATENGVGVRNAGTIGASAGNVELTADGQLVNHGSITAHTSLSISSSGAINNQNGVLAATNELNLNSHSINNNSGTIASTSGDLTLTTSGQLTNNQGRSESARQLTASTGAFLNDNGLIQAGTLSINTGSKDLRNISGEINASDSLDIDSARINNQMGSIRSGNVLNIQADLIDNSGTQSGDQGISGSEVTLNTKTLNNQQGRIQSSGNTDITASQVIDNSDGLISSSGDLTIADAFQISRAFFNLGNQQSFTNTGGTLIANQNLNLRTGTFSGDGRMLSQGDLSLDLGADLIQTGIIQATGNLTLTSSGLLTNQGQLLAGSGLNLTAENLTNSAQGEISAQQTRITATGTVINYGLIDGVTTYLSSRQLQNIGTGRIYGDQVQLSTHTLINREEDNHSAVIAARQSMNIGAYTLINREHALILSLGDLSIGGELDGNGNSTGKATLIDNKSATIESLNDLTINVTTLNNTNEHFSTEQREISREQIKEYQLSGQSQRYTPDQISTYRDEVLHLVTPTGTRDNFNLYEYQRIIREDVILSSDPGQILASGAITLNVDTLLNDLSIIQAGGDLTGVVGSLTNTDVPGQRLISDSGKVTNYWRDKQKGTDDQGRSVSGYNPATKIEDISLSPTRYEGNTKPTGSGTTVDDRGEHQVTETATSPTSGGLVLLPDNSLFIVSPNPAANFLVQTDPQFTNRKEWLSSDFLLEQAKYDPATTQMRLGDGFYEQKLIREQVAQLTGQRFLEGYASDEEQYRQLMLSGATFAEEVQLRPGIALSDAQISQLSSDIVWLVEETVTLADGSQQQVLVPKVYMRVQENDLSPTGSLLAADNLKLELNNNLLNSGTISGRTSAEITADNINNNGGRIAGGEATLTARDNINNLSGTITAEQRLTLDAGQDINSVSTLRSSSNEQGSNTSISRVASIYVSDDSDGLLLASAGNDLNLIASYLGNESDNGETRLTANNDITLGTVTESSYMSIVWDSDNWRKDAQNREIGSQVNVTNDIEITAGKDFTATAANITSGSGNASITTGNDLTFKEGRSTVFVDEAHKHTGSNGMFSKTTVTTRDTLNQDQAIGSNLSAESLDLQAGNNLTFRGSSAVATGDTTLQANNIVLEAAKNTQQQQNLEDKKKSGLFSGGGIGVTIGSQQQNLDTLQTSTTLSGSTVGSIEGNVTMVASNEYRQTASDVNTPAGDISVDAKNIIVEAGHNENSTVEEQSFKQTGVTLSVTNSVLTALQTAERMKELGEDTDNSRLKVLAGATAALSAKQAYDGAVATSQATTAEGAAEATGVGISISLGSSQQSSTNKRTSSEAQQSAMISGGNINLNARGEGDDSDINIIGSSINAGNDANLKADGDVHLIAAQNHAELDSDSKGSNASVGIGFTFGGQQNGFSINAGISGNRGSAEGEDITWQNTQVQAGNAVNIDSGKDTNLKGAVVEGEKVVANVGGDLNVESLQDVSTYESEEKSAGINVSLCIPPMCYGASSVSGNIGKTDIESDYRSVTEQSGIKAGDQGFDITVGGNTDLKGGLIASSDKAIEDGANRLTTATLTTSDIENKAEYDASSMNLGGGFSFGVGDQASNPDAKPGENTEIESKGSVSAPGVLAAKDDDSSTTKSGISGGTVVITDEKKQQELTGKDADTTVAELNRDVNSSTNSNGLDKIFDEEEIKNGFEITQAFVQEVGTYISQKAEEADKKREKADELLNVAKDDNSGLSIEERFAFQQEARALREEAADIINDWGAGGTYRQVSTALIAAASGNTSGSAPTMGQAALVNYIQQKGASYIGELVSDGLLTDGSPEHAALHALVGCAGAAGSGSSCNSGAAGAAASSFLTNLFSEPEPDESQTDKEQKRNLINTIVTGIAASSGLDASAANSGSAAATDNNWLSSRQKAQYNAELLAAESLVEKLQIVGKWEGTSVKQDVITGGGIAAGLASSAVDDVVGLGEFLADPIGGLQGMKAMITDPQVREQMTDQMFADLEAQIDRMSYALEHGGDEQAYQLGQDLGDLIWTVGSVVTGVGGVAKGGVKLAKVGVDVGKKSLNVMKDTAKKAGDKITAVVDLNKIIDDVAHQTLMKHGGAYDSFGNPYLDMSKLTKQQKELMGELFGENAVRNIVPDGTKLGRAAGVSGQGIDDLFEVNRPDVDYVVIEYKFNKSGLGKTEDGKQGSQGWIVGSQRLEKAVGDDKSRQVRKALDQGRVETWEVRTLPNGRTTVRVLDSKGNYTDVDTSTVLSELGNKVWHEHP